MRNADTHQPRLIRVALVTALVLTAAVFALFGMWYRALPWQTPGRVDWCRVTWDRDTDPGSLRPDRGPRFKVTRQPPLVGTRFYSAYPAGERDRLNHAEMGRPCGGDLFTVEAGQRVPYVTVG